MIHFLISSLRGILELIGLVLIGQGILFLLIGKSRANNPVYRFFDLLSSLPRLAVATILPASFSAFAVGTCTFLLALFAWLGLAYLRKFV